MKVRANTTFHYGAALLARAGAEIDMPEDQARQLALHGRVTILDAPPIPAAPEAPVLSRLNRAQLVARAAALGLSHAEDATRAEIIAAIEAATA